MNGKTETLCVLGHPIAHSKSPLMHNALFKKLNINAAYLPYAPNPEDISKAIMGFRALKFRGGNVTIPYKTQVVSLVDELSPISKFTNSVNTLYWKNGDIGKTLCGTTTDPYGCIRNLEENGINPSSTDVALLGNGGAAQAIAYTLMERNNNLSIVCRNIEKGFALAHSLNQIFTDKHVNVFSFQEFETKSEQHKIIINATSVGMTPNVEESPLNKNSIHPHQIICDIVYTPIQTKFLQIAKDIGCKIVSGEGMLVHQGLESFKMWYPEHIKNYSNEELIKIMKNSLERE